MLLMEAHLWDTEVAKTVVFTLPQPDSARKQKLSEQGVEIVEVENLDANQVMDNLYQRGFNSVLWECGGNLASVAIASANIQRVYSFIAPKIIGGINAFSPIGDLGIETMDQAIRLEDISLQQFEGDFLITGRILSNK